MYNELHYKIYHVRSLEMKIIFQKWELTRRKHNKKECCIVQLCGNDAKNTFNL